MDGEARGRGLVLEGGAMRGMFTAGAMDVLMENGVEFDGMAGISAGATFGCNYKSRQIGRAVRYNKRFSRDPRYCGLRSLLLTGDLYGVEFCYHAIPDALDPFDRAAFRDNPMAFYIGATNVRTGEIEYHLCTDGGPEDIEWMRASASMPVVSRPVPIGAQLYLDGGITDPVPYRHMEALGYRRNVIILTQPKGYAKKESRLSPAFRLLLGRYPAVARAMAARPAVYNRQMDEINEREARGESLVIRPPEALGIGRTERDPEALERVYRIGRREAERRLSEVRRFLGE